LRDALVILGINRPIVLGHSWGAAVALALGLNHPDTVRGLVLLSGYYYPTLRADVVLSSLPAIPILGDILRYSISPLLADCSRSCSWECLYQCQPASRLYPRHVDTTRADPR
jgi:pimeloyl-ACP methyl ester carboxylesterase